MPPASRLPTPSNATARLRGAHPPATPAWTSAAAYALPRSRLLPRPADPVARLTLHAVRRMAAHGLRDGEVTQQMLAAFGVSFQRPLVLLRTLVFELSRTTARRITLAPPCCGRLTVDEARLLAVLSHAPLDEPRALRHLARLAGHAETPGVICAAAAYGWALADLGAPLGARR